MWEFWLKVDWVEQGKDMHLNNIEQSHLSGEIITEILKLMAVCLHWEKKTEKMMG